MFRRLPGVLLMALITLDVARWAAEECTRQRSGEMSVAWLLKGWLYAHRNRNHAPTMRDILALGRIVEPRHNLGGLRKVGVRVGADVKMNWEAVPAAIKQLVNDGWGELDADEWYRRYEEIHPFRDGNGRTGTCLWNWHRETLGKPQVPPDFWSNTVDLDIESWGRREILHR
jgi:hypothetical protein